MLKTGNWFGVDPIGAIGPSRTICVLGMHRSGTSVLTGCLEDYGLYLGNVNRKASFNLKGNNETRQIVMLHNKVLADCKGSWDNPPESVTWNPHRKRALQRILKRLNGVPLWGFKDPRTLLTLSGWLETIPNMVLVGTFRHPKSVIQSLVSRQNTLSMELALSLWIEYNQKLLFCVQNLGARIVCFDLPDDEYLRSVNELARSLALPNSANSLFFSAELRNWSKSSWTGIPEYARDLYLQLKEHSIS